ncbi:MAG: tRNA (adenosine(37)-N6)-threonylcarbamoyltransferase complex dimerization subunit type 1 TsaB, partial [Saprospiraceae bacterium]|nr:tRNA (adenosine(37)-N6)-threonylcarbamoyltransferase complex dimerization subunit type 1 TsaB [Saprospiraceae bacterium]
LCIETATEVCSVALGNRHKLIVEDNINRKNSHTETLTIQIENILKKARISYQDLNGVALSGGPGSYTGLRVGSSVAKGICYAWDIPLVAVDTLYGLGVGVSDQVGPGQIIIPMIDARRMEVYTAHYDHQMNELKSVYNVILEEGVFNNLGAERALICGNGALKCEGIDVGIDIDIIPTTCKAANLIVKSYELLKEGKIEDIAYFNPNYHKAPNVTKSKKNILG